MNKRLTKISKYLTFILRHSPASIGIHPDPEGWVAVDALLHNANAQGKSLTRERIEEVMSASDVPRFAFSEDGQRIRAI
jgi:putative RNA 2'-phosphotransferase